MLRKIYDDLVSIYAQLDDIHGSLLDLNWKYHKTTVTDEILPLWALDETEQLQKLLLKLTGHLWELPEVQNGNR